jgi:hypothetical protein
MKTITIDGVEYKLVPKYYKSEINTLKEKYETGNYICVFWNINEWMIANRPNWYIPLKRKLIHIKHEEILNAYLYDNSIDIEVWGGEEYGLIRNEFIDTYDESCIYKLTPPSNPINLDLNEIPFKKKAQENIRHLMNGGKCSHGKYKLKVFQGENGNFYIEKRDGSCETFSGLFRELKIIR